MLSTETSLIFNDCYEFNLRYFEWKLIEALKFKNTNNMNGGP